MRDSLMPMMERAYENSGLLSRAAGVVPMSILHRFDEKCMVSHDIYSCYQAVVKNLHFFLYYHYPSANTPVTPVKNHHKN